MSSTTASATSLNFIGFDDMVGNGTAPVLYNRVVILPRLRETAGKWIHPAAGYVPGQQSYLKQRRAIWSKSRIARDLELQGFRRVYGVAS